MKESALLCKWRNLFFFLLAHDTIVLPDHFNSCFCTGHFSLQGMIISPLPCSVQAVRLPPPSAAFTLFIYIKTPRPKMATNRVLQPSEFFKLPDTII